jgi:hypothetical protein
MRILVILFVWQMGFIDLIAQHPFEAQWIVGCRHNNVDSSLVCNLLEFTTNKIEVSQHKLMNQRVYMERSNASICDSDGKLLFITNGQVVSNMNGNLVTNGDTLANNASFSLYDSGFPFIKSSMILPCPKDHGIYYIIFQSSRLLSNEFEYPWFLYPNVYFAKISVKNGDTSVIAKDSLLFDDLSVPGIHAVKHSDNKSWWVHFSEPKTNHQVFYLLGDDGIKYHHTDTIGVVIPSESGRCCNFRDAAFSYQGDRLAFFNPGTGLEIFRFDRETGRLSDFEFFEIPVFFSEEFGSVAFSPSGRFLYFNDGMRIWQMDLNANFKGNSIVTIAKYDFYLFEGIFTTSWFYMFRTPDCRIAISSTSFNPFIHLIHEPDKPGLLCRFEQRAIQLNSNYFLGLPNYPNFCLGEPCENYCDSLLQVSTREIHDRGIQVRIWPNPVSDQLNVQWEQEGRITRLLLHDMNGRMVRTQQVQGQAQCGIWMQDLPLGFYMLTVEDSYGYVYREKVVKR